MFMLEISLSPHLSPRQPLCFLEISVPPCSESNVFNASSASLQARAVKDSFSAARNCPEIDRSMSATGQARQPVTRARANQAGVQTQVQLSGGEPMDRAGLGGSNQRVDTDSLAGLLQYLDRKSFLTTLEINHLLAALQTVPASQTLDSIFYCLAHFIAVHPQLSGIEIGEAMYSLRYHSATSGVTQVISELTRHLSDCQSMTAASLVKVFTGLQSVRGGGQERVLIAAAKHVNVIAQMNADDLVKVWCALESANSSRALNTILEAVANRIPVCETFNAGQIELLRKSMDYLQVMRPFRALGKLEEALSRVRLQQPQNILETTTPNFSMVSWALR